MPVARRLALLLAVPMLATLVFAAWGAVSTSRQARAADRLHDLVAVSGATGDVIHQLSRERQAAARALAGAGTNGFLTQVAASDQAVAVYRQRRAGLDARDRSAQRLLAPFDGQVRLLPALREQITSRSVSLTAVMVRYRVMIAQGLAVRETVGQVGGADGIVADQLRVAAAVSRAAEYAGIQQTVVTATAGGPLTQAVQRELAANRAGYDEALLTVADRSPARWRAWLDRALSGPQALAEQRFDDEIARAQVGQKLRVNAGRPAGAGDRGDRLHEVRSRIDAEIAATVDDLRTEQWTTSLVLSGAALTLVLVAGLLAYRQGRGLARRLRRVRDAVTRMAEHDLPDLVRRVDAADPADPASMPPAPAPIARGEGRDEVDEVAHAFDTLAHRTYRISGDLARQRRVAAGAVEAVGRRCQGMTHRLMRQLDLAERDEADVKTLETLFAVDNLAAQLLHATQSLLVLSGRSLGAVHTEPVELVTVAQAAQSRIQEYRRVVLGVIDERVLVPPALIDDLVHLLASLLDNATRYSPGDVAITGHLLGDRLIVQATDTGTGIKPDLLVRLNAELAAPAPMIDVEHIRRQGLATVALLAAAHGLRVRLLPARPHGTVAEVEIPVTALLITPPPTALAEGPAAGRRAPDATPSPTASQSAGPGAPGRAGQVAALPGRRAGTPAVDEPTQALPTVPALRRPPGHQPALPHHDTADRSDASPWFVEGGAVHLSSTTPPPGYGVTTANGLPKRRPMPTTVSPPAHPAVARPLPSRTGLARTAAAYQRGLSRRSPHPKEGTP